MTTDEKFDAGTPFDWGRTSADYAKYRDIYPPVFYENIIARGLCVRGQRALDLGTGTGVLPRNLYRYGADWTGIDASAEQIAFAKQLAADDGLQIRFLSCAAEDLRFPAGSFDVITACQCFDYFDHAALAPLLSAMLKPDGRLLILYMAWLPQEDPIAHASEELVLQFHPKWTGAGYTRTPIAIPAPVAAQFDVVHREAYDVSLMFTRETWHGRMRACRGVGAALTPEALAAWDAQHRALLERMAPERFTVLHHVASAELRVKQGIG